MFETASPLDRMLAVAAEHRASDVHITADQPPRMRVDGALAPIPGHDEKLTLDWLEPVLSGMMPGDKLDEFMQSGEVDLSYSVAGIGRFRVNVYRQLGDVAVALRLIPNKAFTLKQLGAPPIIAEFASKPRGLVLVTGPTGSGKSTTLTAMVDIINSTRPAHVITVEDPIEFQHTSRTALIHQREIGADTSSFAEALRRVLRQDPDIILVGELRDPESISTALSAAETGHLVLSTLHTQGAAKSINRLVDAFPAHQQDQVRSQLGDTLQGIISQTLLPKAQTGGRTIATEVLVNTPAVANMIREGQIAQLYSALQAGSAIGMHTLDQDLARLVSEGAISQQVARAYAVDEKSLEKVRVHADDLDVEAWAAQMGDWQRSREA